VSLDGTYVKLGERVAGPFRRFHSAMYTRNRRRCPAYGPNSLVSPTILARANPPCIPGLRRPLHESSVWLVWSIWSIWSIWFVSFNLFVRFIWLNQTNQMNQASTQLPLKPDGPSMARGDPALVSNAPFAPSYKP
jgi:hypothetical protein